ncbi:NADH dehydrogenase-like protein [Prochlorococcus sp. MIT 0602]|nr:NADH dehydrogenase-like protein [Prochlorococcus sp. MIT 0602]
MIDHLVLAGGGHTHALILQRWIMNPHLRPKCLITLINRDSSTIYSGMFPGLVSGLYQFDEVAIDLRKLADRAGVSFILGEINSLDLYEKKLVLNNRPSIAFSLLSLDVGSETNLDKCNSEIRNNNLVMPIKPFLKAYEWIKQFDDESLMRSYESFTVIGSGLAAFEISFALRNRWPSRKLRLQAFPKKLNKRLKKSLDLANIHLINPKEVLSGPAIICTGSKAPHWLQRSGLKVNNFGRVQTSSAFVTSFGPNVLAAGDCAALCNNHPPPSGVWAVKAARPLAKNIEASLRGSLMMPWQPQKLALKLVGAQSTLTAARAFLIWGPFLIGPHSCFWQLKKTIDISFIRKFQKTSIMKDQAYNKLACRGCAAKVAYQTLTAALKESELSELSDNPVDAALIDSSQEGLSWLQSVDGFPALISDPWLNARLTTLHSCSDLWARGASVSSAQAVITLPAADGSLQKEILTQCLLGIQSVLGPQGAKLIGGHTFESRSGLDENIAMGIELSLSMNGLLPKNRKLWGKCGLQPGDDILISRAIGSGVVFAAAMQGSLPSRYVDSALLELSQSQDCLVDSLQEKTSNSSGIHACTDITGFGLLGHLGEMIQVTNKRNSAQNLPLIKINLFASSIPSFQGAMSLLKSGYESSLSPANSHYLALLNPNNQLPACINLVPDASSSDVGDLNVVKKLLIDPQTCGPLVISCQSDLAEELMYESNYWYRIGFVTSLI